MVAEHLLQSVVEQVSGCVVGGAGSTLVGVHAGHEVGLRLLRQLFNDVYALVILALCVYNLHCLVLAYEHAGVAHLASHLAVERCVVEHKFVECVLLLCNSAVAQYVAVMLGVVVAYKLLLALAQFCPV